MFLFSDDLRVNKLFLLYFKYSNDESTCALNILMMNSTSDLDECTLKSDDCQQICVDTLGSFFCQCHTGFHLADDQRTCVQGKHRCHITTDSILLAKINWIMTNFIGNNY